MPVLVRRVWVCVRSTTLHHEQHILRGACARATLCEYRGIMVNLEVEVGVHVVHCVQIRLPLDQVLVSVKEQIDQRILLGITAGCIKGGTERAIAPGARCVDKCGSILCIRSVVACCPSSGVCAWHNFFFIADKAKAQFAGTRIGVFNRLHDFAFCPVIVAEGRPFHLLLRDVPKCTHFDPHVIHGLQHVRVILGISKVLSMSINTKKSDDQLSARGELASATAQNARPISSRALCILLCTPVSTVKKCVVQAERF
mmetsp:Transcript_13450/g.34317  ORF Transcript_13450/g.34317 Transcript_13450/m.34317 type:complete len:256 (+) Transcript_13450:149-916(+)